MATKLEGGHTESVLCATVDENGSIISGGENGELAIWTLNEASPQKYQLAAAGEVAADVTCLACSKRKPHELYASCGSSVLLYDMRSMAQPVHRFDFNDDEIDQIMLNEKEAFLAACDDSGLIKVINLHERRVYKTLRKHANICSAVCFRPRRVWDLFSAGFDCMLLQWDFSRGRTLCRINLHELNAGVDTPESYIINPPFIHSMALSASGDLLACGAENSLVYLFNTSKRTPEYIGPLNGHSHSVAQVHFPQFRESLLISAGNDGLVCLWDLADLPVQRAAAATQNGHVTNGHAANHHVTNGHAANHHVTNGHVTNGHAANHHLTNGHVTNGHAANHHVTNGHAADGPAAEAEVDDHLMWAATGLESVFPKWTIDHAEKINWITSGISGQRKIIVVADNTNSLSVYQCPE